MAELDFCAQCGSWVAPSKGMIREGPDLEPEIICDECLAVVAAMAFFDKSARGGHKTHRPAKTQPAQSSGLFRIGKDGEKISKINNKPLTRPTIAEHFTEQNRSGGRQNTQAGHSHVDENSIAENGQAVSKRVNGEIMD